MQKLGWFGGLGVTQGYQKHHHLIEHIRLPIRDVAIFRIFKMAAAAILDF